MGAGATAQIVTTGLLLGDCFDFREHVVRVRGRAVLDENLGSEAWEVLEGEGLARNVHADGFAQTAQTDVLAFGHIQRAGWEHVQHDALLALYFIAAEEGLDVLVFDEPDDVDGDAGLGAVLGLPRAWEDFFDDAQVFALGYRDDFGVVGFGDGRVEECLRIE